MEIVGCDLHTRYQQIAMLAANTGELSERRWPTIAFSLAIADSGSSAPSVPPW